MTVTEDTVDIGSGLSSVGEHSTEGDGLDGQSHASPTSPNSISTLLHEIGVVADVQPPQDTLASSLSARWQDGSPSVKYVQIKYFSILFMLAAFAFAYVLYLVILFGSIILYVFFNRTYR